MNERIQLQVTSRRLYVLGGNITLTNPVNTAFSVARLVRRDEKASFSLIVQISSVLLASIFFSVLKKFRWFFPRYRLALQKELSSHGYCISSERNQNHNSSISALPSIFVFSRQFFLRLILTATFLQHIFRKNFQHLLCLNLRYLKLVLIDGS